MKILKVAFSFLVLFALPLWAGRFTTTDFSLLNDSNNVDILPGDLHLAAYDTIHVALLQDAILTANSADSSYTPDVTISSGDTFAFYWAEFASSLHSVYRRPIALTTYGYTLLNQETVFGGFGLPVSWLHGAKGTTAATYLTSYYDSLGILGCFKGDSVKFTSAPNNSLAHLASDTFCLVYKEGNSRLKMRRLRISGSSVQYADADIADKTIRQNLSGPSGNFSNSSVAIDSSRNIFITVTRGASLMAKNLEYLLTDRTYTTNDAGAIANNISLNTGGDVKYADAPVISYADNKFASVFWTSAGIFLYIATVSGAPPSVSSWNIFPVVAGNTYRAPTITTNGKKVVILWKNLATQRIEGKVLTVSAGVLSAVPPETRVYSNASSTVADHGPALNAVINENDNIAVTWKQNQNAVGSIWAQRGVIYTAGDLTSVVDSVTFFTIGDSVVFQAGAIDTTLNLGAVTCSLQVGPTTNTAVGWSNWISLADATALATNTKGTAKYFRYKTNLFRHVSDSIKSPILKEVTVNWNLKPHYQNLDSVLVNNVKYASLGGFGDTIDIISHSDTVDCHFRVRDADPEDSLFTWTPWDVSPNLAKDTTMGVPTRYHRHRLEPKAVWDTVYNCLFQIQDEHRWDGVSQDLTIRARKANPVITQVTFDGQPVNNTGTVNITVGKPSDVAVSIERPSVVSWNNIEYEMATMSIDTLVTTASQLRFTPTKDDVVMQIVAMDQFNASDTFLMLFKFPFYTIDSIENPNYCHTKKRLADSLTYILGRDSLDTLTLPVYNTGNDTLTLDSIFFTGGVGSWLKLGLAQSGGMQYFDSLTSANNIIPINLLPDSTSPIRFIVDLRNLTGDAVISDTVIIYCNDPAYPVDTLVVTIEHNDLPTIRSVDYYYLPNRPYWLQKRSKQLYQIPPHAKMRYIFSEPMDTASLSDNLIAYSVFDSTQNNRLDTIHFTPTWNGGDTLLLSPNYSMASTHFNGLRPPTGLYIPTDSIGVILSPQLQDRAQTPSGPNLIDFHNDFVQDTTDSLFTFRVDSINFTLDSVTPKNLQIAVATTAPIVMHFSSPIYPGTIDTATYNNRNLYIYTRYNSYFDSTRQVIFDSVFITDNRVTFIPGKRFFYGDSVYCIYKGIAARDTLGYSIDLNRDGIPIGLFDSASTVDDFSWVFHVEDITNDSVFPDSAATNVALTTPISMTFSAPLFPNTIDTALTANRSLTITSRYSQGDTLGFDSVRIGTNTATFYLNRRLFFSDSVNCQFHGLVIRDSTLFSIDLAGDTIYSTGNGRSWHFEILPLTIVSVSPDSGTDDAGVRSRVSMTFSGPVSPQIFDTTMVADSNKSFFLTSRYSGGERLPMRDLDFSTDSATISLLPLRAYFSYDSIICNFAGFVRDYSYATTGPLLPTDTSVLINTYSWHFLTGRDGFYTFPNPYKPGSNQQHAAFDGIMFKNIHAITATQQNVTRVRIKIFNMNTHPVFESPVIMFQAGATSGKPQWLWHTRNSRGSLVASGVYFYAIYDLSGAVLLKGKLLIVR